MDNSVLQDAILNGLISTQYQGNALIGPQLLTNNQSSTIWQTLRHELLSCKNFTWSVAFITLDMLVPFKAVMADLAQQGVQGTIITSDYLNFNHPAMFEELQKIPNLTVRIADLNGFHTKGYLFDHGEYQTVIIGSANFTRSALLVNKEWNLKLSSRQEGSLFQQLTAELDAVKHESTVLTSEWIAAYRKNWQPPKTRVTQPEKLKPIEPNQMQQAALGQLSTLIKTGAKKGLVVSATGTGKTYLGAFAVKKYQPRRFLYVVHREQIAQKSLASFRRVIGGKKTDYGLLTGNRHDWNAKYLFATVQTLSQQAVLDKLEATEFDYILIDEAHRAAAPSYQRILNHFMPQFWLGMTATPERMDNQDVFKLFDYHLAYEIRLKDALAAKMLAPFHYVGVTDYEVDGEVITETSKLNQLIATKRVNYVLNQLDYYGYCGDQPRGLVFCSRQAEAKELAVQFNAANHPAIALTNQSSSQERAKAVEQLEAGKIEYIITVDLFNEGVDIPSVNQIVMMRNTQSPIVFTQQLGRGLRQYPGKDFVTVIDSANLSTGIGLQVVEAAVMAQAGKSAAEITAALEEVRPKVRASFVVDTLMYLYRGGRCNAVAAMAGSVLKLHPKIVVENGAMDAAKKYRGKLHSVVMSYVRDMEADLKNARPERVFITHSGCDRKIVEDVQAYLQSLGIFQEILETRAGGVVSSHCGPGTLGVLFIAK